LGSFPKFRAQRGSPTRSNDFSSTRQNVEFPKYFGTKARLTVEADSYRLDPILIEPGTSFVVAALRHPATKEASGKQIEIRIG